ncbi:MAG: hypothetical protein NWF01_04810 [Candidatus Bathyarchaeota archaeon]|nr:hypothetical protein [Candidatus Bathyarchaeota archaeon]
MNTSNSQAPSQPPTTVPDLPTPTWTISTLPDQQDTTTPSNSQNNSYLDIQSNSTITQLYFNSTNSELSFTVTGPEGTTGYVQYRIAKSLLSSVQNVKVYLDGNQLSVNITSNQDEWLLYFTYHHSSHTIVISLNTLSGTEQLGSFAVWVGALIAAIIIAVITLLVWRGKHKLTV